MCSIKKENPVLITTHLKRTKLRPWLDESEGQTKSCGKMNIVYLNENTKSCGKMSIMYINENPKQYGVLQVKKMHNKQGGT